MGLQKHCEAERQAGEVKRIIYARHNNTLSASKSKRAGQDTRIGLEKVSTRLMEQPIFYPVMNIEYARQISVEWNVPAYGIGYVTKFEVDSEYLKKFEVQNVGSAQHNELWVPAEELEEFNSYIIGKIEVVETHTK